MNYSRGWPFHEMRWPTYVYFRVNRKMYEVKR